MPHFVVSRFHDVLHYAVEHHYSPLRADGRKRYPPPLAVIELPEHIARLPLDELITMFQRGVRPKPAKQSLAIPAPDKPATTQPRNEMG